MTNSVKTVGINRGNELVLGHSGMKTDVIEVNDKTAGSAIGCVNQRQDQTTETYLSKEMNRLGEMTGGVSSAETVDKREAFRGGFEIVSCVEDPNT